MTIYVLPFEKMHGLGNDFVMVESRHLPSGTDEALLAKYICNRNFGVGADGLIVVDLSTSKDADFEWAYYNSDGFEAEMCGNGMRCFAKYVFERGFTDSTTFLVRTKSGIIKPTIEEDGLVSVDMGLPKLPNILKQEINVSGKTFLYTYIEVGNPHCVIFLENEISAQDFYKYGPLVESHSNFPNKTNVEFVNVINKNEINCKVWERGCGPTLACGTGACASLLAANINNLVNYKAKVYLPGGILDVTWDKSTNHVFLKGPATFVFTGQLNLDPATICKKEPSKYIQK